MTRNGMRAALNPSHEVNGCLRLASIPGRPSVNGEALSELSSEIFGIGTTNGSVRPLRLAASPQKHCARTLKAFSGGLQGF